MASPGHRAAAAAAARKQLRVLVPFARDLLRIPDELAEDIGAGEALVVGKVKVWSVAVARDGAGAFLGRGWPEFADVCGAGEGWLLVLRHRGRGMLTVKAFDASCCLSELVAPPPAVEATTISNTARKPRFMSVLSEDFMENMLIPAKFVEQCIPNEHLNNSMAIILGPHGKIYNIKLEMVRSDVFFTGGWSQFVEFHGITKNDSLLLRYEGNMVFTVKVFGPDGCQRESKHEEIRVQETSTLPETAKEEAPPGSIWKRRKNNTESFQRNCFYKIVPPSWIRKKMNTSTLETHLALTTTFCDAIGLRKPRMITLKTSMDSTVSWLVQGLPCKTGNYLLVQGWKRFCQENNLKEGDICTFNVIKTTLWHVVVTRCQENMNQLCHETPENHSSRSCYERQKRPKGSMTYLNNAKTRCVFEIGPPAWVKKEMNATTIQNQLNLPLTFCEAVGLRQHCTIMLKTSMSSTRSWLARLRPYELNSHLVGHGWKKFCHENSIKVGDICTFTIVETNLWHVTIVRR